MAQQHFTDISLTLTIKVSTFSQSLNTDKYIYLRFSLFRWIFQKKLIWSSNLSNIISLQVKSIFSISIDKI